MDIVIMGYKDSLEILSATKYDIKNAIYEKGVEVEGGLVTYADAIRKIKTSDVDYFKVYKGVKFGGSTISQFPKLIFEEGYIDASLLFVGCDNITTIPQIDMTKFTNTGQMFDGCVKLGYLPPLNLPNIIRCEYMFASCGGGEVQDIEMINSINAYGMFKRSNLTKINKLILPKAEDVELIFYYCRNLVEVGELDISGAKNCEAMFEYDTNLITLPQIDLRSCRNLKWAFDGCYKMESFNLINTGGVKEWNGAFRDCKSLKHGPKLDTSSAQNVSQMFSGCPSLESLPLYDFGNVTSTSDMFGPGNSNKLTDLGGFMNLKSSLNLSGLPNLTVQSLMNVINNLYDFVGNGVPIMRTLTLGTTNLNKLTDEQKAVATNKRWVLE